MATWAERQRAREILSAREAVLARARAIDEEAAELGLHATPRASSICLADIGAWDWQRPFSSSDTCRARPRAHIDSAHGEFAYVNESAAAGSSGSAVRAVEVVMLPGATSMTFTVAHKQGSTSGAFVLGLWTGITSHPLLFSALAAPLASAIVTPTSTIAESSVTATAAAGTVLFAGVAMNSTALGGTANQRHLIGNARVSCNSTDSFWGSYLQRIHVDDDAIVDNAWDPAPASYVSPYTRGRSFSPGSRLRLLTTATEIGVEMLTTIDPSALGAAYTRSSSLAIFVDGRYFTSVAPTAAKREVAKVENLPAGMKVIEIVHGYCVGGSASTWLQAVYVSATKLAQVLPAEPARRRMVWFGDSISAGMLVTGEACSAPVHVLRSRYPGTVIMDAFGNRRLSQDLATGGVYDAAKMRATAANIARHQPDDIYLAIGTNDYAFNEWTAANFGTAYAALLDELHTLLPAARIYCQSPLTRGSEVANGLGDTTGAYRTQIQTAATTRTYCTFVNGTAPGNQTADGIHLSDTGTWVWLNYVLDIAIGLTPGF